MIRSFFALIILCLTFTSAFADSWKHARLKSREGIEISIDYQVREVLSSDGRSRSVVAWPIWINLVSPILKPGLDVRTQVFVYSCYGSADCPMSSLWNIERAHLSFAEGTRYTGQIAGIPIRHIDAEGRHQQMTNEIYIAIGYDWLVDPVNGTHGFKFRFLPD